MLVRKAGLTDAGRIAEIHVRTWQAGYADIVPESYLRGLSVHDREIEWRRRLTDGTDLILVAEDDNLVVGWLGGGRSCDADADSACVELHAIYVDPAHWRRGVGRHLWNEFSDQVRDAERAVVTLWVFEENIGARRFYESLGFAVDPGVRKSIDLGGKTLDEVRYRIGRSGG
jgi:GNAT superfamily N-acetyltransferase